MSDMYEKAYFDIQKVLDEALGPNEEDGAGEGIVSDVLLALAVAERRGQSKGLRIAAHACEKSAESLRALGFEDESRRMAAVASDLRSLANRIASGEDFPCA